MSRLGVVVVVVVNVPSGAVDKRSACLAQAASDLWGVKTKLSPDFGEAEE